MEPSARLALILIRLVAALLKLGSRLAFELVGFFAPGDLVCNGTCEIQSNLSALGQLCSILTGIWKGRGQSCQKRQKCDDPHDEYFERDLNRKLPISGGYTVIRAL